MFTYILLVGLGFAGGAICVYVLFDQQQREVRRLQKHVESQVKHNERVAHENSDRQKELEGEATRLRHETAKSHERAEQEYARKQMDLDTQAAQIERKTAEFNARVISFNDLQNENIVLKRDLRNLDIGFRKLQLDRDLDRKAQQQLDERSSELAGRYLKDNVRWVNLTLSQNNYTVCKQRLLDVIARCRDIGFDVTTDEEGRLLADLQTGFEKAVRAALEREEQARIKARIREEQRLERETEREVQQAESERKAIEAALERALREAHDQHSAEIEALRTKLADAEARSQRAISMAQLTKSGHVYVISNIGSFGQDVFKVGLTRRLEPMDRVKELGDASVPFPFDVHMMISCEDAPSLETALHRELHLHRINRINPRKEFFRIDIETIRAIVERNHGVVEYVADPEALEYHQSLTMTDEDQEFIDRVYEAADPEDGEFAVDDQETE